MLLKLVAVTRAEPEAQVTAARLRDYGAEAILAPLLKVEQRAFNADLGGVQALVFTSANGVRAFASQSKDRSKRVLAVGEATAILARDAGFADVRASEGDSASLTQLITSALDPKAGTVLHISGAHLAADLVGALAQSGFTAENRVGYEAVAVSSLPAAFSRSLDIVLFHSARAARVFTELGAPNSARMIAACMSPAVAKAASVSPWKQVVVAQRPTEDALLQAALGGKNT